VLELAAGPGDTGFLAAELIPIERTYASAELFLDETLDLSPTFADTFLELDEDGRFPVQAELERKLSAFAAPDRGNSAPGTDAGRRRKCVNETLHHEKEVAAVFTNPA
jgi:hypothetical protein